MKTLTKILKWTFWLIVALVLAPVVALGINMLEAHRQPRSARALGWPSEAHRGPLEAQLHPSGRYPSLNTSRPNQRITK